MTLVRVIKGWRWPDLSRQTPQGDGTWGDWQFTEEPVTECDGVLVLNYLAHDIHVRSTLGNVWLLCQEPDVPGFSDWMREGHEPFSRVFTHSPPSDGSRYVCSQPALPWHLGRDYQALQHIIPSDKQEQIAWVTSALRVLPGHRRRMAFLEELREGQVTCVDLYGRGMNPIDDKWDVLYPAKYALAVENARQPDYWTEKIADCFLSWALPVYDGCPNILDYFPEEAIISIDIDQPQAALDVVRGLPGSGEWERRRKALGEARRLVLEEYQFFPWMSGLLGRHLQGGERVDMCLRRWSPRPSTRLRNFRRRWGSRLHGLIPLLGAD
jgi:hypothetical protein